MKQVANLSFLKKLTFIFSIVSLAGFSQFGYAQEIITVQQAIDKALTNNLQVKQSKLSESLADENLKQAKLALYPSLNSGVNQNMNWGRNQSASGLFENTQRYNLSASLSSGVDLFAGFSKINQIKQNKVLLDAGKTNTEKVKNDLILQVITSYLQILYNKDFLKAAQDQLTVAKQQLNQQQQLLNEGNKTLADLSQAKSLVATAELNVTNAENALSISYLTLAQLMDVPSATVYDVQLPLLNTTTNPSTAINPEEIYRDALSTFPDVKLAELYTAASRIGVNVAKGNLYPRLSFNGSYGTSYFYSYNSTTPNQTLSEQFKNNLGKGIGLNLQIPIFNRLQARSGVTRAKIDLMQTETQEQLAKNNLSKIIYQAVADLKAAESRYQSTTNAFLAQKDAYYVIEERYNVGLVNSLEYSTAQTNKNKAEIDMIQAKYDLLFRAKVIDYYLGKQITF
ncbi:TolC family protein [Pedobacter insulae]|uniref:Outer membrane protein n=1 Tax=Pedobacter insulae TaxID=414048 RepID=A0A1I2W226_9SPHI|nr:TolC family protein [Pedobacter insulae]SFG94729.1 outer membrane protein [Pedobacter insulae]